MQDALGETTNQLRTPQDFERNLPTMANVKPTVTFLAEDVTEQNAELLARLAKESLCNAIQITSARMIPTPAGSAILRLKRNRTMPTAWTTADASSTIQELISPLRGVDHQNARLPLRLSRMFAKGIQPLRQVQRSAAQQALCGVPGSAIALPSPLPTSSAIVSRNVSSSTYTTPPASVVEGCEQAGPDRDGYEEECFRGLIRKVVDRCNKDL